MTFGSPCYNVILSIGLLHKKKNMTNFVAPSGLLGVIFKNLSTTSILTLNCIIPNMVRGSSEINKKYR